MSVKAKLDEPPVSPTIKPPFELELGPSISPLI